ncbi:hypothetical protein GCM10007298_10570 [Williamsia phyllosphaerae]|uniref:Secreted protein n=1 Tax=Williamsia phyllosphaerae TaxID=885042 RepID=A0ABQ1UH01_9NOCA|nr:hypothetical protein GCM10007298_10570 [Williamsia phyllosphaerae]
MLVEVTLMIASVGCSILGSGTSSTLTFRLPCQVTARMDSTFLVHVDAWDVPDGANGERIPKHSRWDPTRTEKSTRSSIGADVATQPRPSIVGVTAAGELNLAVDTHPLCHEATRDRHRSPLTLDSC